MQRKIFFLFLLLLVMSITGYFSLRTAQALFTHFACKETTIARITRWELKENRGKFFLKACYSFESNGKSWRGVAQLKEAFLNEEAATASLREKAKQQWKAWFNPIYPKISCLEKNFPINLGVRTLTCYGVLLYFVVFFKKSLNF